MDTTNEQNTNKGVQSNATTTPSNTPVKQNTESLTGTTVTPNPVQSLDTVFRVPIQCAIRRKLSLVGLPGADPNERIYKLGSSLDSKTGKNLKGIEGELEKKYMPSIIGINYKETSPCFI